MATEKFSLRSVLTRAETTQSGEVKPLRSLDKMADAIRGCTNYRVTCEAELARIETARDEMQERLDEARKLEAEAQDELKDMVRTLCGVKVD